MKVVNDAKYAKNIRDRIINNYRKRAEEENAKREKDGLWHVSDLVFPRKTYFELLEGRKTTDEAIGFWFTGVAFHKELQYILGIENAEKEVKKGSIIAHIDHFDKVLLEIKTSRKWTIPEIPQPHYIRQAGYYGALTKTPNPKIVVIYPTAGRTWDGKDSSTVEIGAWTLQFSKDELDAIFEDMHMTIDLIEEAVKKKDISILPPVEAWVIKDYLPKKRTRKQLWALTGKYDYHLDQTSPFNIIDLEVRYE